ncbi:hypothetical protein [Actinomadura sp. HBU206391]|uniref:hypothetical protein n=1 Tax=Actinomadura sp. HBU206391 TaxID=2731692 RepID=UPI00165069A3|nr:hypothetical protein [Actinomadura sp. HBU206391]MBC6459163.1 hypothetical protein [Actinomadura sp. HBU206391]
MGVPVEISAQVGAVPIGSALPEPGTKMPVPVPSALEPVLGNGLRRGWVVSVTGPAAGSLGLALMAEASSAGGWCAVVGVPELGVVAAAGMGIEPARLVLVDEPSQRWPEVVAALLEGVEVVLLRPAGRPNPTVVRRLTALARRHGSVLVSAGAWEGAHVRLQVREASWVGVGNGHGHLRGRQALIQAEGRGAAGPGRQAWVWLPDPDGQITAASTAGGRDLTTTAPGPLHPPLAVAT